MNVPTAPYLKTMTECHKKMMEDGYKENFVVEEGSLKCAGGEKRYSPADVSIVNFFRFEGQSDPDDNSIMYVIETNDGLKGTITDAYGAYADAGISEFIASVESIEKKKGK